MNEGYVRTTLTAALNPKPLICLGQINKLPIVQTTVRLVVSPFPQRRHASRSRKSFSRESHRRDAQSERCRLATLRHHLPARSLSAPRLQDSDRSGPCEDDIELTAPYVGILPEETSHEHPSPLRF